MVPFICNFRGENNKAPRFYLGALNPAERTGFEPANRFCRLHISDLKSAYTAYIPT